MHGKHVGIFTTSCKSLFYTRMISIFRAKNNCYNTSFFFAEKIICFIDESSSSSETCRVNGQSSSPLSTSSGQTSSNIASTSISSVEDTRLNLLLSSSSLNNSVPLSHYKNKNGEFFYLLMFCKTTK